MNVQNAIRLCVLLFGLSFVVCAFGQNKAQPSLKETLEWMDNTFNGGHRGFFQQWDRDNKLQADDTYTFTYDQCTITETVRESPDAGEAKYVWSKFRQVTLRLSDIDPTTIRIVPHDSHYMTDCTNPSQARALDCTSQAEVLFSTRDEKKILSYKSDTVFPDIPVDKPDHESLASGNESSGSFAMRDTAYAKRFAKAFRHAVELCGGTRSAF